jgi:hypothetical protein
MRVYETGHHDQVANVNKVFGLIDSCGVNDVADLSVLEIDSRRPDPGRRDNPIAFDPA